MSPKEPRWLLGVICQCQSKSCGSRPCPERPRPQRPRGLCVRGPAGLNASRQASGASPAFSASSSVTVLPSTAAPASVPRPPGCWSLLLTSARRPPSSQPTPGLRALPPPPFTHPPPAPLCRPPAACASRAGFLLPPAPPPPSLTPQGTAPLLCYLSRAGGGCCSASLQRTEGPERCRGASPLAQGVKNPPARQETQVRSWVRKISPRRRAGQPTPVSLPEESLGQRSGAGVGGFSPWGHRESNTAEHTRAQIFQTRL